MVAYGAVVLKQEEEARSKSVRLQVLGAVVLLAGIVAYTYGPYTYEVEQGSKVETTPTNEPTAKFTPPPMQESTPCPFPDQVRDGVGSACYFEDKCDRSFYQNNKNPCLNGATCEQLNVACKETGAAKGCATIKCQCQVGWSGTHCSAPASTEPTPSPMQESTPTPPSATPASTEPTPSPMQESTPTPPSATGECGVAPVSHTTDVGECKWTDTDGKVSPPKKAWDNAGHFKEGRWNQRAVITPTLAELMGAEYQAGTNPVVFTATDQYSNTATCSINVTVVDDQRPQPDAPCPLSGDVELDDKCAGSYTYQKPTWTDNCQLTEAQVSAPVTKTFSRVQTEPRFMFSFSATDQGGNVAKCSFGVRVMDSIPPTADAAVVVMELPAKPAVKQVLTCSSGMAEDNVNFIAKSTPSVSDNCDASPRVQFTVQANASGAESVTLESNHVYTLGLHHVTMVVTDASNNKYTSVGSVMVVDNTVPELRHTTGSCIKRKEDGSKGEPFENIVIDLTKQEKKATVKWEESSIWYFDNSCGAELTRVTSSGDAQNGEAQWTVGTHQVMYEAKDASGQTSTCTFEVTVKDVHAPEFQNCPKTNIEQSTGPRDKFAVIDLPTLTATDAVDGETDVKYTPFDYDRHAFPIGESEITATSTDKSGNVATCTFWVHVIDDEDPFFEKPNECDGTEDYQQCGGYVIPHQMSASEKSTGWVGAFTAKPVLFDGNTTCCNADFTCQQETQFYSTCREEVVEPTAEPTAEPTVQPSVGISTGEPTVQPSVGISTAEPTGVGISTAEPTVQPSVGISTAEPTVFGTAEPTMFN